jgi:hypothetical protein
LYLQVCHKNPLGEGAGHVQSGNAVHAFQMPLGRALLERKLQQPNGLIDVAVIEDNATTHNTVANVRQQISEDYVGVGVPLRHSQPQQTCGFCPFLC